MKKLIAIPLILMPALLAMYFHPWQKSEEKKTLAQISAPRRTFSKIQREPIGYEQPIESLPRAVYFTDRGEWSPPLTEPKWVTADSATHMKPNDPVVGIYYGKQAWALPWWVLKNYHVADLEIEGHPLLITFCEVCSSASVFDPFIDGKQFTFRMVGMYNGTHIISDYQTDSIWGSFTGEAIAGKLKDKKLQRLRLLQCLWKEWQELHPSTMVIFAPQEFRSGHGHLEFPGRRSEKDRFFKLLVKPLDTRLPSNELVVGVLIGNQAKAYALKDLDKTGWVLNDSVGGEEIVVIHKPGTMIASAFSRKIGNEILHFEEEKDGSIVDRKHRRRWNVDGEAIGGALSKQTLSFVPSGVEEWYVWAAYHPDTSLFQNVGARFIAPSRRAQ